MNFKRLPLVVAMAAAVVAPAAFGQSNVTLYGKLYPHILNESGSGATAVGTPRSTLTGSLPGTNGVAKNSGMTSGNSRVGVRGSEDLGGGMKAEFQLETSLAIENGTNSNPQFWDRDTFVGLDSKQYGTIRLGLMDTIFKNYGDTLGILGVSSGTFMSSSNILRKPGFGTSNAARFHERMGDSVQYESPKIADFQFGIQASDDGLASLAGEQKAYSFGVNYDNGPLYIAIAHEIHNNYFGGSAQAPAALRNSIATGTSKDRATQFTIEWRMDKRHKFEFDVIQKQYNETGAAGRFRSYKNTAYLVAMENRWDNQWRTAAHYVKSNAGSCSLNSAAACNTAGLDGSKLTLGASYYLSRRTYGFGAIAKLTNGKSARFSTSQLVEARTNYGEDLTQFAVGLAHSF